MNEADRKARELGYEYDPWSAEHAVCWFERCLRHYMGRWAGQPFTLQPWQRDDVVRPLFGWIHRQTGFRRFRQAYIEIPKKNGKSTLCGGLGSYLLAPDGEPGAQVFCAANDRNQAGIVYRECVKLVLGSPALSGRVVVLDSVKTIKYPEADAFLRVISADAYTAEGLNIHGLIFDELHAQKSRALWDALRYGGAAREQPLLISITTAGADRTSICYEQHQYARMVLEGVVDDPHFFAYLRGAEEGDDWKDETVWAKANPSLGTIISLEDFRSDFNEALASPAKESSFKRYRLNIWTDHYDGWLSMERWAKCGEEEEETSPPGPLSLTGEGEAGIARPGGNSRAMAWRQHWQGELAGAECTGGLDLGSNSDLTALVLLFRLRGSDDRMLLPWFWLPEECIGEREREHRAPYGQWVREGWINPTEGDVTDYDQVRSEIGTIAAGFGLRRLLVDRAFQGDQLILQLRGDGLPVESFINGILSMTAPSKEFERLVGAGKLRHGNNPVLAWMAGNVAIRTDVNNNMMPTKRHSSGKIDGIVAGIMALAAQMVEPPKQSVYNTRGLIRL